MGSKTDQKKLSPKDALTRFEDLVAALRDRAGTSPQGHGTEHYLFEKIITGIADAIRFTGSPRITLTYAEWALLANARDGGKRTSAKNVERIFSKWADAFDGFSPADGVVFAIQRPGKRGPRFDPGRAGAEVTFWTEDDLQQSLRPPQRPSELPLLREVRQLAEASRLREALAPSRLGYLNEVRHRIGDQASQVINRAIERIERRLATEHSRRVAAYFVTATLAVFLIGGGVAIAEHRAARERLIHTLKKFSIGASAMCDGETPTVLISFAAPSTPPPFVVFRNDQIVGKIKAPSVDGLYRYVDTTVSKDHAYVYRVGKQVWGIGEAASTSTVSAHTPNCRPADNLQPEVSEIAASKNPAAVAEPVRLSVSASDYEGAPLRYFWSLPSLGIWKYGASSEEFRFPQAGYHSVSVSVDDGFDPVVARSLYLGVAGPKTSDRPPIVRRLFVGPRVVRPGDDVRASVAAHDPDGGPLQYFWSYDDKASEGLADVHVTTSYSTPGSYRVGVRVIDSSLFETQEERKVTVSASAPAGPRCKWIAAAPSLWPSTSTPVTMTVALADGSPQPTHVTWDFGDGSTPTAGELAARHTYARAGVYSVVAEIENARNNDVCHVDLNVGGSMPPNKPLRNFGTTDPMGGTSDTTFLITAQPPVESQLNGKIVAYRFTFADFFHGVQRQTNWQPTPIYRIQFLPGSWSVAYEVRYEGDRGTAVYSIGDIPVTKP